MKSHAVRGKNCQVVKKQRRLKNWGWGESLGCFRTSRCYRFVWNKFATWSYWVYTNVWNLLMRAALGVFVLVGLVKTVVLRRRGTYGLTLHVLQLSIQRMSSIIIGLLYHRTDCAFWRILNTEVKIECLKLIKIDDDRNIVVCMMWSVKQCLSVPPSLAFGLRVPNPTSVPRKCTCGHNSLSLSS